MLHERDSSNETLHVQLRRNTATLHRELDGLPFLARLLRPDLTRAHYLHVLRAFHSIFDPLEARLFAAADLGASLPEFQRRRRASLLADDIGALEGASVVLAPPASFDVPTDTLGSAFGVLYVLEGSTLRGAVLAARAKTTLGLVPGQGASFFGARGDWTGPAWASFLVALEAFASAPSDEREESSAAPSEDRCAAAITSARATFQSLIAHFRRAGEVTSQGGGP